MTDEAVIDRMAKARAARKPKAPKVPDAPKVAALPEGHVRVRIMKRGHEKIFTGQTLEGQANPFPTYKQGDEAIIHGDTATKYEDAGLVEILP